MVRSKGLKDRRLSKVIMQPQRHRQSDLPKLQVLCTGVLPNSKILRRRSASLYKGNIKGPKVVMSAVMDNAGWSRGISCSAPKAPVESEGARFLLSEPGSENLFAVGELVPELPILLPCFFQKSSSCSLFPRSLTVALANRLRSSACSQLFPSLP